MSAPAQVVMIIRHAEKPTLQPRHRGVTLEGRQSKDSLTPVGWMRAGALLELFAPREPGTLREGLYRPASLFASNAKGARGGSDREEQTVALLSWKLGLTTNVEHAVGQERELARAVQAAASPALICWEHRRIAAIAAALGTAAAVPERWPNNRYDQVWVLSRQDDDSPYAFEQVPELLLPGDREAPI